MLYQMCSSVSHEYPDIIDAKIFHPGLDLGIYYVKIQDRMNRLLKILSFIFDLLFSPS